MALFKKSEAYAEPSPGGGANVLRGALRNYNRGPAAIGRLHADLQLGSGVLEAFANGGDLPAEKLSALAAFLFGGHAEYDAERDLLRSLGKPATVLAPARPASTAFRSAEEVAAFFGAPPPKPAGAPRPVKEPPAAKAGPAWPRKAGWA